MLIHYLVLFMVSNVTAVVIQIIVSPYDLCHFSLAALKDFSLSLGFNNWILICLGTVFFELILFGVLFGSVNMHLSPSFSIISSNTFSAPISFSGCSGFSGTLVTHVLDLLTFPHSLTAP